MIGETILLCVLTPIFIRRVQQFLDSYYANKTTITSVHTTAVDSLFYRITSILSVFILFYYGFQLYDGKATQDIEYICRSSDDGMYSIFYVVDPETNEPYTKMIGRSDVIVDCCRIVKVCNGSLHVTGYQKNLTYNELHNDNENFLLEMNSDNNNLKFLGVHDTNMRELMIFDVNPDNGSVVLLGTQKDRETLQCLQPVVKYQMVNINFKSDMTINMAQMRSFLYSCLTSLHSLATVDIPAWAWYYDFCACCLLILLNSIFQQKSIRSILSLFLFGPIVAMNSLDSLVPSHPLLKRLFQLIMVIQLYGWLPSTVVYQWKHKNFFFDNYVSQHPNPVTLYIMYMVELIYFQIVWMLTRRLYTDKKTALSEMSPERRIANSKWTWLSLLCFCDASVCIVMLCVL